MNESDILKIVVGIVVTGIFGLNVKIVWDWLCSTKINKKDIDKLKKEVSGISEITKKTEKAYSAIFGNGTIDKSIAYRITAIEDFIKELKKIKENRGL